VRKRSSARSGAFLAKSELQKIVEFNGDGKGKEMVLITSEGYCMRLINRNGEEEREMKVNKKNA
jgi:hypothetical protein